MSFVNVSELILLRIDEKYGTSRMLKNIVANVCNIVFPYTYNLIYYDARGPYSQLAANITYLFVGYRKYSRHNKLIKRINIRILHVHLFRAFFNYCLT